MNTISKWLKWAQKKKETKKNSGKIFKVWILNKSTAIIVFDFHSSNVCQAYLNDFFIKVINLMLSYDFFDINWDYYLNECSKLRARHVFVGNLDKQYGTTYIYTIMLWMLSFAVNIFSHSCQQNKLDVKKMYASFFPKNPFFYETLKKHWIQIKHYINILDIVHNCSVLFHRNQFTLLRSVIHLFDVHFAFPIWGIIFILTNILALR